MGRNIGIAPSRAAVLVAVVSSVVVAAQPRPTVVAFEGGRWFTGQRFEEKNAYVSDGILSFRRPTRVDVRVDLRGRFVVPPFGEAHNHNVEPSPGFEERLARYIEHGIFYVKNPNSLPRDRPAITSRINTPTSIDATFANGGWTGVDGHPIAIVLRNIRRGAWTDNDADGGFYWSATTEDELARKWPLYLAQKPQFVKTYLLFSEEFDRRRDDSAYLGWKGLNPTLLPGLVRRAHEAGLRVSVHVETAADFHVALLAGVDEVAHLPGFRGDMERPMSDATKFEISDTDARLAARNGTVVVTTVSGATRRAADGPEAAFRRELDAMHRRNLQALRRGGVRIAIGSDAYDRDAAAEAMYLNGLGVFEPVELLRMWTETTAKTIFPQRHIGVLEEGAEASFIVLARNPLDDFAAVQEIVQRVKQGAELRSSSSAARRGTVRVGPVLLGRPRSHHVPEHQDTRQLRSARD